MKHSDKITSRRTIETTDQSSPKFGRMSGLAKQALTRKIIHLREYLRQLNEQAEHYGKEIAKAPLKEINHSGGKRIVRMSDPVLVRMHEDIDRAIWRCKLEISEAEFMLSPPSGRPSEAIYRQALQDLDGRPNTPIRQLAQKYFPNYFPDRAGSAVKMMSEGLRRARKKRQPPAK